jgi:hypothetical protein
VLKAALQRDPENKAVIKKLKGSRRVAQDTKQCKDDLQTALMAREFMHAVDVATEGLQIEASNRSLNAFLYMERAKAYRGLARQQARGAGESGSSSGKAPAQAGAEKAKAPPGAAACWRQCIQSAVSAAYHHERPGGDESGAVDALLIKVIALYHLTTPTTHSTHTTTLQHTPPPSSTTHTNSPPLLTPPPPSPLTLHFSSRQ